MKPLFLAAILTAISLQFSSPAYALQASASASAKCQSGKVVIDWALKNTEPTRALRIIAQDSHTNKRSDQQTAAPGATVHGAIQTGLTKIIASSVNFSLRPVNSNGFDTFDSEEKTAGYSAADCRTAAQTAAATDIKEEPADDSLPNTGPLESFILISSITIAAAAAWIVTQKELKASLKRPQP